MLVMGAGIGLAALVGFYYWSATGVAVATISAAILAAYQVYLSLLPPAPKLEQAARRLAGLVEDNWGTWRRLLLGQAKPANVAFVRMDGLRFGESSGARAKGQLSNVRSYYERLHPPRLVILGEAGSGKTMLAVELALQLLERGFRGQGLERARVAVPVSVAGWTGDESLQDWLIDRLTEAYHLLPGVASELVEARRILPVLDGLDEIAQDPDRGTATVRRVLSALNTGGTSLTPVVITCRDRFYENLHASGFGVHEAAVVRIDRLTAKQVSAYIYSRFLSDPSSKQGHPDWNQLHLEIEAGGTPALVSAFEVPWLMTLATTVCDAGLTSLRELTELADRAPAQLHEFLLDEFIPAAVSLHPKGIGREQIGKPQYSERYRRATPADRYKPDAVKAWMTALADHLRWQETHEMSPTDIQPDHLWLIAAAAGKPVRAVHTAIAVTLGALMGSLSAEYTGGFPGVVITCLVTALGAAFGLRAGLWTLPAPGRNKVTAPLRRRVAAMTAWFLKPPSPSRVNIWQALMNPWWACLVAVAGIAGGVAGFVDGGTRVGVTEGLAAALAACVLTGLSYGTSHAISPEEPLTNDLIFGLVLGGVAGVATGLPGGLTGGLAADLHLNHYLTVSGSAMVAIIISLLAGVALGSRAWLRYTIALFFVAPERTLPWHCLRFLDWAATAGLLRISGINYQFRHDDLRRHLEPQVGRGQGR